MTPPSVTLQGAQLKRYKLNWVTKETGNGGDWCLHAEAAERIAALAQQLADALRDAERLAKALEPFLKFNSSEPLITLRIDTTIVRQGRAVIADYYLSKIDAARQPEKDANNG